MSKPWAQEDDSIIRTNAAGMNDKQLSILLGRTPKAITHRRLKLGLQNIRSPKSSMKRWTKEEDQFLIDNYGKMTYSEMAQFLLGRTSQAIEIRKKYVNDRLVKPRVRKSSGLVWTNEEDEYLMGNYGELTYEEMTAHLIGRSAESIQARVQTLGFERDISRVRSKNARKYSVNDKFFSVPDIINSYYAGFIAADGSIDEKSNRVAIRISRKDEHLLEQLIIDCNYTGEVNYYLGNDGLGEGYVYADFRHHCQPQWVSDLQNNFNITPRKTFTLEPPENLNEENTTAFIRGFIDGDGFISYQSKTKDRRHFCWAIGACGTKAMMEYLKFWFDKWVPDKRRKVSAQVGGPYGDSKVFKYQVSGKRALLILNKLLSVETPYLKRKWDPVISYFQSNPLP